MIIVKIFGGLGNQMFQYAFGRNIAHANKTELFLDLSWFKEDKKGVVDRQYGLDNFNIQAKVIEGSEFEEFKKVGYLDKFLPYYMRKRVIQVLNIFDKRLLKIRGNKYLEGYWQGEKYFNNVEPIIKKEFTLKKRCCSNILETKNMIKNSNSVSVHFRRGDYVVDQRTGEYHGVCGLDYYERAIKIITRKVKNPILYIFSDDVEWVKNNFEINFPMKYISNNKIADYQELILLSLCKNHIIANSTFSWWGAWLCDNKDKIIIAPKRWFNQSERNKKCDIIPENWIKT